MSDDKRTVAERFPVGTRVRYVGDIDDPILGSGPWVGIRAKTLIVAEPIATGYVLVIANNDPDDWFNCTPEELEVVADDQR